MNSRCWSFLTLQELNIQCLWPSPIIIFLFQILKIIIICRISMRKSPLQNQISIKQSISTVPSKPNTRNNNQYALNSKNKSIINKQELEQQGNIGANPSINSNLSNLINNKSLPNSLNRHSKINLSQIQNSSQPKQIQQFEEIQIIAMNLSANIFMKSTTKFLKGYNGLTVIDTNGEQRKPSYSNEKSKRQLSIVKRSQTRQKSPSKLQKNNDKVILNSLINCNKLGFNQQKSQSQQKIKYPSRQKIQKIVKGESYSRPKNSRERLRSTIERKRLTSNSINRSQNQELSCSHSKSGSTSRFSRTRQRSKSLKFLEKKQKSIEKLSSNNNIEKIIEKKKINEKQKRINKSILSKLNSKNNELEGMSEPSTPLNKNRIKPTLLDRKSNNQQNRQAYQIVNDFSKVALKNQKQNTFQERRNQKTPSILSSDLSLLNFSRNQGYKINALLPSGQLPLETPVKSPKFKKQTSKIEQNKTNLGKNKATLPTQISAIKQQNSSQIYSSRNPTKKIGLHGSRKEEASTHIQYTPTNIAVANQNSLASKFAKNESTKALGKEQQTGEASCGLSTLIRMQEESYQKPNVVSIYEPRKNPISSKSSKEMKLQIKPINTTQSLFGEKQISKKQPTKMIRSEIEEEPQSSILYQQPSRQIKKIANQKSPKSKNQQFKMNSQIAKKSIISQKQQPYLSKQSSQIIKVEQSKLEKQQSKISKKNMMSKQKQISVLRSNQQQLSQPNFKVNVIPHVLRGLYGRKMKIIYNMLISNLRQKIKINKHIIILIVSASKLSKNLSRNNLINSFNQFKKITLSNPLNKKPLLSTKDYKAASPNLITKLLQSKFRQYYDQLKVLRIAQKPKIIVRSFQQTQIPNFQQKSKQYLLSQLFKIVSSFYLTKGRIFYPKIQYIYYRMLSPTPNSSNKQIMTIKNIQNTSQIIQKINYEPLKLNLCRINDQIQSDVFSLEHSVKIKRRNIEHEKSKLGKRKKQLTDTTTSLILEVKQKRVKNIALKDKYDSATAPIQLDTSLPQFEPFVGLLTQVYSIIFNHNDIKFETQALVEKYNLKFQQQNHVLVQWRALWQNMRLKSELTKWEGAKIIHHSKQVLLAEQQLIIGMLKSYLRERYLWEWIKVAAERF